MANLSKYRDIKKTGNEQTIKGFYTDETKVVRMLILVVLLFIISWSPLLITTSFGPGATSPLLDHNSFYKHLFNAVYLIAYTNSCINPIVYGFLSKNFRQSFWTALCPCLKRNWSPSRQ
ncbi:Somatostatin receptor type 5, partial [Armadillidium vulgare]